MFMVALGFFRLSSREVAFIVVFSALVLTQTFTTIGTFSATSSAASDYEVTIRVAGLPATCYTNITVDDKFSGRIGRGESKLFKFESGTAHTIGVEKYVYESADTRYYCLARTAAFSAAGACTFVYTPQFYLTIDVIPEEIPSLGGAGWYDEGAEAMVEQPRITVSSDTGTRYSLLSWTVDGMEKRSPSVIMYAPHNVVVRYKPQYFLTVESAYGNLTGSGWYNASSPATFRVTSPLPIGGLMGTLGVKYVFDHWTGDSNASTPEATVLMDSPKKVMANWKIDYTPIYILRGIVATILTAGGVVVLGYGLRNRKVYSPPFSLSTPQKASCKYCGTEKPAEAPYCPKCGKKQSE